MSIRNLFTRREPEPVSRPNTQVSADEAIAICRALLAEYQAANRAAIRHLQGALLHIGPNSVGSDLVLDAINALKGGRS